MNDKTIVEISIDTIMEDAQLLKERIWALMEKENIFGCIANDTRESMNNLLDDLDFINDYLKNK